MLYCKINVCFNNCYYYTQCHCLFLPLSNSQIWPRSKYYLLRIHHFWPRDEFVQKKLYLSDICCFVECYVCKHGDEDECRDEAETCGNKQVRKYFQNESVTHSLFWSKCECSNWVSITLIINIFQLVCLKVNIDSIVIRHWLYLRTVRCLAVIMI